MIVKSASVSPVEVVLRLKNCQNVIDTLIGSKRNPMARDGTAFAWLGQGDQQAGGRGHGWASNSRRG